MKYIVNTSDIKKNIEVIKETAGKTEIIGVLKGNGYGFGIEKMAELLRDNGINTFAVTEVEDAVMLKSGVLADKDILMLRSTAIPEEIEEIAKCGAIFTVGSIEAAKAVDSYCVESGITVKAHIAVDCGMGRYGFLRKDIDGICEAIESSKSINYTGIYTHFSSAFTDNQLTRIELAGFLNTIEKLGEKGYKFKMVHCANSSAFFNVKESRLDAARIGSAFTGRILGEGAKKLIRVGHLEAKIAEVKTLPKNHPVGYYGTYKTKRETKVAIIPVGHTDGWGMASNNELFSLKDAIVNGLRNAKKVISKNKTTVSIGGKSYPIIGQIGLSHTAVDVTESDVKPGDTAILDMSPLNVSPTIAREYSTQSSSDF